MADKIMLLDGHSLLNRAFYECGSWLSKYHASLCRRGEANASSCGI